MTLEIKLADKITKDFAKFTAQNPLALSRAMNDALAKARTASLSQDQGMRKDWVGMRARDLKRYTYTRKASSGKATAQFVVTSRPIPLIEFGAKQIKRGVSYRLKKKRRTMRDAWVAPSKFGNRNDRVFVRSGTARKVKHRVAITPTSMFINAEADDIFESVYTITFQDRYNHHLRYLLG